ncbi:MAG: hypothetical protein R2704_16585 [Microthrixaceae bacterium]
MAMTDDATRSSNDRLVVVVKADCPTCVMATPAIEALAAAGARVLSQDDPGFPAGVPDVVGDTELSWSVDWNIEVVPTLLRVRDPPR